MAVSRVRRAVHHWAAVSLVALAPAAAGRAAPPGSIPVLCTAILAVGETEAFGCERADTATVFVAVPAGLYLHVTDVLVDRNNLATTGDFRATIGRESGSILPADPHITASGTPTRPTALHFGTPVIILHPGESLAANNDGTSDFPINIYASGYLAPAPGL